MTHAYHGSMHMQASVRQAALLIQQQPKYLTQSLVDRNFWEIMIKYIIKLAKSRGRESAKIRVPYRAYSTEIR